jgi:hypothetical protein
MTTSSSLPKVMKAAVVDAAGPPEAIHIKDVPVPSLPSNHVLIALQYVGVGIWDAEQRAGSWGAIKPGTIMGAWERNNCCRWQPCDKVPRGRSRLLLQLRQP